MCRSMPLTTLAATLTAAFGFAAAVFLSPELTYAADGARGAEGGPAAGCSCPDAAAPKSTRPKFAELKTRLDASDEIATLHALQVALSEVGDGATYVWHRRNGKLSGSFQPTTSFKDAGGRVCRHIRIMLASGNFSRTAEGIACRLGDGSWQLDG